MSYKLSKVSKERLVGVDPRIVKLIERSLKKSPHDFGIPANGGKRTAQEQNNLFHKRPRVTTKDGFKLLSYHQSGKAFDIFVFDEHGACWKCLDKYKEIADVIKQEFKLMQQEGVFKEGETLGWGGDWKRFVDLPHFEVR